MISKTTKKFREGFQSLSRDVQKQATAAYKLFSENPQHPSLHFKKIKSSQPIYSARINLDYRALAFVEGEEIVWFWIGKHADYDKILKHQ